MKLTDLNRERSIGASSLHVEIGPFQFLVDAGMNPKYVGHAATPEFSSISDGSLDFIVLTHCHLDHLGTLPLVARRHPQAEIFMSVPSRFLAKRMLHNSCNIMTRQREETSVAELPLYTHGEISRLAHQFHPVPFARTQSFHAHGDEIKLTLYPAGHVAGACGIEFQYKHRRIFFTGDVLFTAQRTLPPARFPEHEFDTLVMETTRGATERRPDSNRQSETKRLISEIARILSHRGSILIPVFAFGRMQEILCVIWEARRAGQLRSCPIYCSGLGLALADVFDEISRRTGRVNFRRRILKDLKLRPFPDHIRPGEDPSDRGSGIYILSSGMLVERTPSYRAAASLLEFHRNALFFAGYCDPDTPGGQLLATAPGEPFSFDALDYVCPLNAHIERFDLTSHADREELLSFALSANPRAIVLTHGEPDARDWFHDSLLDRANKFNIIDPDPGKTYLV